MMWKKREHSGKCRKERLESIELFTVNIKLLHFAGTTSTTTAVPCDAKAIEDLLESRDLSIYSVDINNFDKVKEAIKTGEFLHLYFSSL